MDKTKTKIISYILANIMFISSCNITKEPVMDIVIPETSIEETTEEPTILETELKQTKEPTIETTSEIMEITTPTTVMTMPIEQTIEQHIQGEEILSINTNTAMYTSNTTDSMKICNIKINESAIKILSCNNNWSLVKYNNHIGYINNDNLESTNNYIETDYEYTKQSDILLTTTDLNFRKQPNTSSEIIRTFRINTELELIAKVNNGWLLVKYNGVIGYVHGDYTISLFEQAKKEYPELELNELDVKKVIYTKSDNVTFGKGNNIETEVINTLEKYESLRVISEYEDWYLVLSNDYKFGFINKNYTETLNGLFVIVDLSEQRLYFYNNNELYCVASVTTGKDSTPSDIGLFKIWYKGQNEEIVPGYIVDYWMPYNYSMEGLHDAYRWRTEYGMHTEKEKKLKLYKKNGSNGCINMQLEDAKTVYENSEIGTKVLVGK